MKNEFHCPQENERMISHTLSMTADKLVRYLIEEHITITTMESCTSGLIASLLTDTEGASEIYPGGYVTYSNQAKIMAGVPETVIREHGVYSPACAIAMAKASKEQFQTKIAIGVTGTCGNPDPNNADSVAGELYYAIINGDQEYVEEYKHDVTGFSRTEIKQLYAFKVLTAVLKLLTE